MLSGRDSWRSNSFCVKATSLLSEVADILGTSQESSKENGCRKRQIC